jgi:hypothetical protein
MNTDDRTAGYRLLETGTTVPFRIIEQELTSGPDDAEFAARVELQFDSDEEGEDYEPDDIVEWGAFGFLFTVGALSFADARPREASIVEYAEKDELTVSDFLEHLRFVRGELHVYMDYIRGRRIKTEMIVRPNGTARLQTFGRGNAAIRWLERIQGKKMLQVVERP